MSEEITLTYTSALILVTVKQGCGYGFDIMDTTGLPSGTVYPALRRFESAGLIRSRWESKDKAFAQDRPARRYYFLTEDGQEMVKKAIDRYPPLSQIRVTTMSQPKADKTASRKVSHKGVAK